MQHDSTDREILSHLADPTNPAGKVQSESDCELNSQRPQINLRTDLPEAECYNTECREDDMSKAIGGGGGGNAEETSHGKTSKGKVTIVSR